jgi:hypothetical protein
MFFEKHMASNVVIQAEPAFSEQVKLASLTQEVVRRIKHTSLELPHYRRLEVLEQFSQKLANSGHGLPFMERILLTRIAKYKWMVEASNQPVGSKGHKPLHQPSGSCMSRFRKKMLAKQNWYKDGQQQQQQHDDTLPKDGMNRNGIQKDGKLERIATSTGMFATRRGLLTTMLKAQEVKLANMIGFRAKYQ